VQEGRIIKVSGPLVVAEGLRGAKMYDLLKVGVQRLMGEIIELRGETASIQVYEETAGLGPGDPVYSTGEPLSVELGPGLLESIYDGVQRPLNIIRDKVGDFIVRGVEEPGIDRNKKWLFEPRVSVGDQVGEGDILGVVQETPVIEHRILVPPGLSGLVKEIYPGEHTVEEPVALIQSEDKIHPVCMLTRWPVRKPRPYKEKLTPSQPLVIGQRVIDTLFPIAKGGTACIPGPFGSGKCVTGETPVLMGDGRIFPIKELFDTYHDKGKKTKNGFEEYTILDNPLEVFSYVDGKIVRNKASAVYKCKTDKILKIKTRTGRIVKVTPIHKLLKINDDLVISRTEAQNFKKGDYLIAPRLLDFEGTLQRIPLGERQSKKVRIPAQFDKKLAIFLGLLLADGSIKHNSVRFYNNDEEMLDLFDKLAVELFGLSVKRSIANTVKCSLIESSILVKLLKYFGFPEYQKSRSSFIPQILYNSPKSVIGAFLGAYFACDGYFHPKKGEIEYSTASEKMQSGLSYLLLRLGILSRLSTKSRGELEQYKLFISGRDEVEKFYTECALNALKNISKFQKIKRYLSQPRKPYTNLDIVPLEMNYLKDLYLSLDKPYAKFKKAGVEIHNYLNGEIMSKNMFTKFAQLSDNQTLSKFATNHLEHIYCDKIVEIEEINRPCDVYDLEVPGSHNFIGGNAPMFYSNTVVQHEIAKWADAEVIVFIGCGERGNEMTEVLIEFPQLTDPYSGEPLMKRTVLIANTSNMPVAAREASVYTGVTIAEYYRDMGYNVALSADSTSRWAEALREISGRLEEMPGEEGYPAYLGSRAAAFYERAGLIKCLASNNRQGSLTIIGSVSPPGGDLSEPVTQATLRIVKVFWGLEDRLAYKRHFPAINWLISYSLYLDRIEEYWNEEIDPQFSRLRNEAMSILQREAELEEIVRLVGIESLSPAERLLMETARSIREDFLQQDAYHEIDTFTSLRKQFLMLRLIITFYEKALPAVQKGVPLREIFSLPVRERISRAKFISEDRLEEFEAIWSEMESQIKEAEDRT